MTSPPPPDDELQGGFIKLIGIRTEEATADRVVLTCPVTPDLHQPFGLVHGGAYAALAESMASATTHLAVQGDGDFAVGQSNHTHFFRPATEGAVHAEGTPIHRGRTSWVWDVSFTDDEGRLCASSRVTLSVRPAKSP